MNPEIFTPKQVKEWLEFSPQQPGPMAENLRGFLIASHYYCTHCCGRLSARGILLPQESKPVWTDTKGLAFCSGCERMR